MLHHKHTKNYMKKIGVPFYKRLFHFHKTEDLSFLIIDISKHAPHLNIEEVYHTALARRISLRHQESRMKTKLFFRNNSGLIIQGLILLVLIFIASRSQAQTVHNDTIRVAGNPVATGTGASTTGTQRVAVSNDSNVIITPPTLSKSNQGATGLSVQELHDAGRTLLTFTADAVTPAASDTLVTFVQLRGTTSTGGVTSYAIAGGKVFRVMSLSMQFTSSTTTANKVRLRLRTTASGACTAASLLVGTWELALPTGTLAANQGQAVLNVDFPEGIEFGAGAGANMCLSAIAAAANGTLTFTLYGYEY